MADHDRGVVAAAQGAREDLTDSWRWSRSPPRVPARSTASWSAMAMCARATRWAAAPWAACQRRAARRASRCRSRRRRRSFRAGLADFAPHRRESALRIHLARGAVPHGAGRSGLPQDVAAQDPLRGGSRWLHSAVFWAQGNCQHQGHWRLRLRRQVNALLQAGMGTRRLRRRGRRTNWKQRDEEDVNLSDVRSSERLVDTLDRPFVHLHIVVYMSCFERCS